MSRAAATALATATATAAAAAVVLTAGSASAAPPPAGPAFVFTSDRGGTSDLWYQARNGRAVALTDGPAADFGAAWSPDGRTLAFVSDRDGDAEIYTMRATGGPLTQLTVDDAAELAPTWSPTAPASRSPATGPAARPRSG